MNADDHAALLSFKQTGLLDYGRIPASLLGEHGFTQTQPTHWLRFTDAAWALAHELRKLRADRRGPYATRVFEEVAAREAEKGSQ